MLDIYRGFDLGRNTSAHSRNVGLVIKSLSSAIESLVKCLQKSQGVLIWKVSSHAGTQSAFQLCGLGKAVLMLRIAQLME